MPTGHHSDRPSWDQFRTAYLRIEENADVFRVSRSPTGKPAESGLRLALDELTSAFMHRHVRSDDGDNCALCGLDLRNDIHIRE